MTQKAVEKHECHYCESLYKILFDLETTSGPPRFCPFCGSETYDDDIHFEEKEDE